MPGSKICPDCKRKVLKENYPIRKHRGQLFYGTYCKICDSNKANSNHKLVRRFRRICEKELPKELYEKLLNMAKNDK